MDSQLQSAPMIRDAVAADAAACARIYNQYVGQGHTTFDGEPRSFDFFERQIAAVGEREAFIVLEDVSGGASMPGRADAVVSQPTPDEPVRPAAGTLTIGDCSILGYGRLFVYSDRCGYRTTGETSVYLQRTLARRGYGSLLKRELIARARSLGYHSLVARAVASNAASVEYNRRLGYELVGTLREAGWVNGRWWDVAIMQLILEDGSSPDTV